MQLTDRQLRAAAAVLAAALAEYEEAHVGRTSRARSRDYGRGFATARTLLAEWADEDGEPATVVQ